MLTAKEFLEEECKNVRRLLNETLRHEYGNLESREFYDESSFRLDLLSDEVRRATPTDTTKLDTLSEAISRLSALITRIERSHLGEFSWPFANALQRLAAATCRGTGLDTAFKEPLFFISADGGLVSYRIHAEQRPIDIIGRRIFNIVFPRSLKHHVLLHPILGHEIGHAAWSVPSMQHDLLAKVLIPLFQGSPLAEVEAARGWLQATFGVQAQEQAVHKALMSWAQEFLCDLFGLLLMGPSFVAAHLSLLLAVDPSAQQFGDSHPPSACRFWMVREAARALEWDRPTGASTTKSDSALRAFWAGADEQAARLPPWSAVFDQSQLTQAVTALSGILAPLETALYKCPERDLLGELLDMLYASIPPVGKSVDVDGNLSAKPIDFRTILYGGWLAWHDRSGLDPEMDFFSLNRLCDHAILQQEAVAIFSHESCEKEP